jgi:hypothetical protein
MLDGHKDDVSYNLYLSSAGILLQSFCFTYQKYVYVCARVAVHDVVVMKRCHVDQSSTLMPHTIE